MNLAAVLQTVRNGGPLSRAEIARATGLSRPTINEVTDFLLAAGYLSESVPGTELRRPGPRARLLRFRSDLGYVLGIDVGAKKVVVLAADLSGAIVGCSRRAFAMQRLDIDIVLEHVRLAVADVLAQAGITESDVKAAGVGTPGLIDPGSSRLTLAPQLPGWEGLALDELFADVLSFPLIFDNEVRLSLAAERWRGAARKVKNALLIQIGYCIGAAILIDGEG